MRVKNALFLLYPSYVESQLTTYPQAMPAAIAGIHRVRGGQPAICADPRAPSNHGKTSDWVLVELAPCSALVTPAPAQLLVTKQGRQQAEQFAPTRELLRRRSAGSTSLRRKIVSSTTVPEFLGAGGLGCVSRQCIMSLELPVAEHQASQIPGRTSHCARAKCAARHGSYSLVHTAGANSAQEATSSGR